MKIKATALMCVHETKYGNINYIRLIKKNENLDDVIEEIKKECNYDENEYGEYFNSDIEELIIDTDDFEAITDQEG